MIKLEGWARDGLTNEQIAKNMGVTRKTLQEWCVKFSDICDTLKRGKEIIDYEVENALLKRAIGYKTSEMRMTKEGALVEVEKEVPGDVTAQIFWLKNRKPDKWKDSPKDSANENALSKLDEVLKEIGGVV